uniref:tRNA-intron lyase n=1 Tax=Cucumis melo TaxID=3656 RepID=A0A9I9DY60_CUCME
MAPRWKGKASEAKALADPISSTVLHLQSSFIQSNARGLLSGSTILYLADEEQTDLLNRTCFGRQILTAEKDKQWFQFGMEEAFYLSYHLNCLKIVDGQDCEMNFQELWRYMKTQKATFPEFYIAYRHLRLKNWVVRPGSQYGVDFVAYRHHPALVHSEFAVLVLSEGRDSNGNGRLRVWSDFLCTIRLCGSVAKTLLVLSVNDNGITPLKNAQLRDGVQNSAVKILQKCEIDQLLRYSLMKMNYVRKIETKNFEDNVNDARKGGRGFNMSNTATRGTTEKSYPFQ